MSHGIWNPTTHHTVENWFLWLVIFISVESFIYHYWKRR